MSLILEALRKSEAERRRGLAPDVAMELPPTPASRQRPLAAWLLPVLVVAVLVLLAGWWARRQPATSPSTAATIEDARDVSDTTYPVPTESPAVMPRIETTPAPPVVANVPAAEASLPVAQMPAPTPLPQAPTSTPTAAPAIAAARPAPMQALPTQLPPVRPSPPASDISDDTSMLPPIKLSMHMWDNVPAKRFVILNGQRMSEGDRYSGIAVIAIERDGVVVESNGAKARVPLP